MDLSTRKKKYVNTEAARDDQERYKSCDPRVKKCTNKK